MDDLFGYRHEPKAKKSAPTWVREACQDWETGVGGIPSFARIGAALKPLVHTHGWHVVQPAWRHYLKVTPTHLASAHRFAETYAAWVVRPKPIRGPGQRFKEVMDGQRLRLVPDEGGAA